ncbi:5-formyltetrahydrofolate cyclo-ligase [Algoriphagus confluentis]|uniref:5-formyltetrahydrofolate cyclo-ligase n=1 Tax=Algoriphagus confluentis TaxID=1697556 RepID=A0ABQ6PNH4_9BACT|nr:5-formyltetrahydrofolate cyclo-ligase [Algoriphagus confluentis]
MKTSTKAQLRAVYRARRMGLSSNEVENQSKAIAKRVMEWLKIHPDIHHLHLFFPIIRFNEVNTFLLREELDKSGKTLYTSRVNRTATELETLKLPKEAEFFEDEWGIPVPQESIQVSSSKIQLVFVPLLAYDGEGNRVGFGKGYYDSFLGSMDHPVIKMGLSFFPPEGKIEAEPHDVSLDYCVTPEKIFTFSS